MQAAEQQHSTHSRSWALVRRQKAAVGAESEHGRRSPTPLVYAPVTQLKTETDMIARWFWVLLLAMVPTASFADYELQFIRTTCVPEAGYMQVEYRDIPSMMTTAEPSAPPLVRRKVAAAWARQGLRSPRNMTVDCSLSDHVYHISADQEKSGGGFCMAYPQIWLRITKDSKPWLEAVIGGQECDGGSKASIESIEVGNGAVNVCVSTNAGAGARCKFIWPAQQDIFPLDQADIEAIAALKATSDTSDVVWKTAVMESREARKVPASKTH